MKARPRPPTAERMRDRRLDGASFRRSSHPGIATIVAAVLALPSRVAYGDLNPAFGDAGRVTLDPVPMLGDYSLARSVIEQPDGRIVVAGRSMGVDSADSVMVLARFEPDGALDASFGNGGIAVSTGPSDLGSVVMRQADGKLVVAGNTSANDRDIAIWRFDSNGTADATFGFGGMVSLDLGGMDDARALVEQPDGKLLVAARTLHAGADADVVLARFNGDGSVDSDFGSGGVTPIRFPSGNSWEYASSLMPQADGKLLVTGFVGSFRGDWFVENLFVIRTTADGVLDGTFADDGVFAISLDSAAADVDSTQGTSLALQADGKVVVAGAIGFETGWGLYPADGFVLRLQSDGTLDPAFGTDGVVINDLGEYGYFTAVALQPEGRILAAGFVDSDMAVTRFNTDGSTDAAFGASGTEIADFGMVDVGPNSYAFAISLVAKGGFVLAGRQSVRDTTQLAVAVFGPDGDRFPGLIGLTRDHQEVSEDDGSVAFRIRRTGGSTGAVSVLYETENLTAVNGSEYFRETGRLDWGDADSSDRTVSVRLIDNAHTELAARQFRLRLSEPTGGANLAASVATVSILDDEQLTPQPPAPPQPAPPASSSSGGGGVIDWLWLGLLLLFATRTSGCSRRLPPDRAG